MITLSGTPKCLSPTPPCATLSPVRRPTRWVIAAACIPHPPQRRKILTPQISLRVKGEGHLLSENAMNSALPRMGFGKDEVTAHGFRASASTILNERGFEPHVIEAALGHRDDNAVRRAYNRPHTGPSTSRYSKRGPTCSTSFGCLEAALALKRSTTRHKRKRFMVNAGRRHVACR